MMEGPVHLTVAVCGYLLLLMVSMIEDLND